MSGWRDWAGSPQDLAALARLTSAQYPDAPITAEGIARHLNQTDSQRPFLVRFAVQEGREVAFVESYPLKNGTFLLELAAPGRPDLGAALLTHAHGWAQQRGAQAWEISVRTGDGRLEWLTAQGFSVQGGADGWKWAEPGQAALPPEVRAEPVGDDPGRQDKLRHAINAGRQELGLPPFDERGFTENVLEYGMLRPDLLWLALTRTDEVIGAATLHVWEAGAHAEALWLSVSPGWRRRGLGSGLLAYAASNAARSGIPLISANSGHSQGHLIPLLQRAGFTPSGGWLTLRQSVAP